MARMSALKDRLRQDLTAAMKSRDEVTSGTLRMALAAVSNAEVAGKQAKQLDDAEVVGVLAAEAKRRREAAAAYDDAQRPELAAKERAEAEVLARYLPEQLSEEQVRDLVTATIADLGVAEQGMKAMGRVMGAVQPQVKGRADGGAVADEVRRQLA